MEPIVVVMIVAVLLAAWAVIDLAVDLLDRWRGRKALRQANAAIDAFRNQTRRNQL